MLGLTTETSKENSQAQMSRDKGESVKCFMTTLKGPILLSPF